MGKQSVIWRYGGGILLALAIYLSAQLFLAALVVRGIVPEASVFYLQAATCGISVLLGGLFTLRRSQLGTLCAALIEAGGFALTLSFVGLVGYDQVNWMGRGGILLLSALSGGALAGILGARGKRRHKKGKRK